MPVSSTVLSDWHFHAGALDRLLPPWQPVTIKQRPGALADGARTTLKMQLMGMDWEWIARHEDAQPGLGFTDVQERGPFASWSHRHSFLPQGSSRSVLEDRVDYELPCGLLGGAIMGRKVARDIERMFVWRHHRTRNDLHVHAPYLGERLRVAVSGTTGLLGSALVPFLTTAGHDVRRIVRSAPDHARGDVHWDQRAGTINGSALEGLDGVVHLAGAGIADKRWTAARKRVIVSSRVDGTRAVAEALAALEHKPRVLVCASAVGYYGSRDPDETLTEESDAGEGFLADTCRAWEAAAQPAVDAGIRVVHLRIGMVVSGAGGALPKLLTPFKLGLGGPVGSGKQAVSWIALDDLLSIVRFALSAQVAGPLNAVAPNAVTNRELGKTLGRVLGRPAIAPLPAAAVHAGFGEMGQALLLEGSRVAPRRLERAGFKWLFPDLERALRFETGQLAAD